MTKKICSMSKGGIKKAEVKEFCKMVDKATHFCQKCGRVAADKKHLCKPKRIFSK